MNQQTLKSMYSPMQVATATFLSGPLAGGHLLWSNFIALGKSKEARVTVAGSIIGFFVMLIADALLPLKGETGGLLVGLIFALSARQITEIYQLKKGVIANSDEYSFQSNWKVFGITLVWLIFDLILIFAISFILVLAGVHLHG